MLHLSNAFSEPKARCLNITDHGFAFFSSLRYKTETDSRDMDDPNPQPTPAAASTMTEVAPEVAPEEEASNTDNSQAPPQQPSQELQQTQPPQDKVEAQQDVEPLDPTAEAANPTGAKEQKDAAPQLDLPVDGADAEKATAGAGQEEAPTSDIEPYLQPSLQPAPEPAPEPASEPAPRSRIDWEVPTTVLNGEELIEKLTNRHGKKLITILHKVFDHLNSQADEIHALQQEVRRGALQQKNAAEHDIHDLRDELRSEFNTQFKKSSEEVKESMETLTSEMTELTSGTISTMEDQMKVYETELKDHQGSIDSVKADLAERESPEDQERHRAEVEAQQTAVIGQLEEVDSRVSQNTADVARCATRVEMRTETEQLRNDTQEQLAAVKGVQAQADKKIALLGDGLKSTTDVANACVKSVTAAEETIKENNAKAKSALLDLERASNEKFLAQQQAHQSVEQRLVSMDAMIDLKATKMDLKDVQEHMATLCSAARAEDIALELTRKCDDNLVLIEKDTMMLKKHANELEQMKLKLQAKASRAELESTQQSILDTCASKEETIAHAERVTIRVDRLTTKLVEFDKRLMRSQSLVEENQERIDQLGPALLQSMEDKMEQREGRQQERMANSRKQIAAITSEDTSKVLEVYGRTQAELEFVHENLREVREIMEGKNVSGNEDTNSELWQQMIAFRKLFVLSGGDSDQPATSSREGRRTMRQPTPPERPKSTADKERWEGEDKKRWMVENRMPQEKGVGLPPVQ
jgi:hypothetical protein